MIFSMTYTTALSSTAFAVDSILVFGKGNFQKAPRISNAKVAM